MWFAHTDPVSNPHVRLPVETDSSLPCRRRLSCCRFSYYVTFLVTKRDRRHEDVTPTSPKTERTKVKTTPPSLPAQVLPPTSKRRTGDLGLEVPTSILGTPTLNGALLYLYLHGSRLTARINDSLSDDGRQGLVPSIKKKLEPVKVLLLIFHSSLHRLRRPHPGEKGPGPRRDPNRPRQGVGTGNVGVGVVVTAGPRSRRPPLSTTKSVHLSHTVPEGTFDPPQNPRDQFR